MLGVKTMAHFIFECLFCVSFLLLWKESLDMSVGFRILQPPVLFCVLFYPLLLFWDSKRGICLSLGYVSALNFKTILHVRSIQASPRAQIILSESHPMSNPYKLPHGLLCHIRKGPHGHVLNPEHQKSRSQT